MVEQDKKLMRHMWANIVILIVAVFAILLLTQQENYARQMQQINKYIGELSDRTAQHARDVFQDRQDAISSIAYLYGQAMTCPTCGISGTWTICGSWRPAPALTASGL